MELSGFSLFIVMFFVLGTLLVLIAGIIVMGRGGKLDEKWSNRLMTMRVVMQAFAILTVLALFAMK